jgi:GH18 family chitinase
VNGVKAIAMGGGAGDGGGWVVSTATLGVRTTFIANILDKCVAKNYDGVDIDWEDSLDTPAQQNQLIALLTELRTAAAARPRYQAPNAPFLITFPTLALNINIDLPVPAWKVTVASLVDQFNIMTYDMRLGCCGWETWLWAALKGATATTPMSVESSIQGFVDAGVPRTKLGFGLGFYGGGYGPPVSGPHQAIAGYWGGDDNVHNYRDFYTQNMFVGADVTYVFDAAAQTGYYRYSPPRVYQGNNVSVLVTEDPQSISAKGAWSRAGNASGVIIWSINYGYIAALGSNPPLEAVKQAFLPGVPVGLQSFSVE